MEFNSLQVFANMFCIDLRLPQKKTEIGYERGTGGIKYPLETLAIIEKNILKKFLGNKQHIHFDNVCCSSCSLVKKENHIKHTIIDKHRY